MPTFVYLKAQNKLGYSCAIYYTTMVKLNDKVFQSHKVTGDEALKGMEYLSRKYKVRVRIPMRRG